MESFRTVITPQKSAYSISHSDTLMCLGSCFSENIGLQLFSRKFKIDLNPFGVIFNPISIANSINALINRQIFAESDLFFHEGLWHSFYHHSRFSNIDKQECLKQINNRLEESSNALNNLDYLFITFGTSHIFKEVKKGQVVSNCHKLPSSNFTNQYISVEEIVDEYKVLINKLKEINPRLKIIFTVSPVRHLKDGAVNNQLSKATLLVAVHKLCEIFDASYFPAYELLLDDLRDYRFYDNDMVHPSKQAVEYIWKFFSNTYFDAGTIQINSDLDKLNNAINHRPVNMVSEGFKAFTLSQLQFISQLEQKYSFLNFSAEKEFFSKYIK